MSTVLKILGKTSILKTWCSDVLHNVLGYSDVALASYLSHVAAKSKSAQDIIDVLEQRGLALEEK